MSIVNSAFSSRNLPVPKWLTVIYVVLIVGVNLIVAGGITFPALLVILAGVVFIISIGVTNGRMFRISSNMKSFIPVSYIE